MTTKTAIRNNRVYIAISDYGWSKPEIITGMYLTNGDYTYIPDDINAERWNGVFIVWVNNRKVTLMQLGELAEYTEIVSLKPRRGHEWRKGEWRKAQ